MLEKLRNLDLAKFIFLCILPQILVFAISFILITVNFYFDKYGLMQTTLILPISFIVIPYIFLKKTESTISIKSIGIRNFKIREIMLFLSSIIIITVIIYLWKKAEYTIIYLAIQTLIVTVSEEIWARGMLIFELKENKFSCFLCVLVSSVVFTFITHQNRPIMENLICRFPFAILLGVIYYKTEKIEFPILIHYLNNMIGGV